MKRFFLVLACFAVLLLSPAGARGEMEVDGPWRSKLILVYLRSNPDQGAMLRDAHVEKAGTAGVFLVGKQVVESSAGGDWREGAELWIPLDNIGLVMVYGSLEEYQQRAGAAPSQGRRSATTRPGQNLP
jgi:hypothetical protein